MVFLLPKFSNFNFRPKFTTLMYVRWKKMYPAESVQPLSLFPSFSLSLLLVQNLNLLPPSQRFLLYMVPAAGATLPLKSGSEAKLSVPCPPPASSSISTISLFPVLSKGPGTYCRVCGPLDGQ